MHVGHGRHPRVCLLQISTVSEDFLVDVLVPEVRVNATILAPVFANDEIIKVWGTGDLSKGTFSKIVIEILKKS